MQYTYFILCTMIFSIALNIIYFSKKHVVSGETKIFSILLVLNFFGLLLEFLCALVGHFLPPDILLSHIMTKVYLLYLITFVLYMTLYIYTICYTTSNNLDLKHYRNLEILSYVIYGICALVMFLLPIKTANGYATGLAINFVYVCSTLCMLIWFIPIIKNRKTINFGKIIPLFCFMVFMTLISIIQKINPQITIVTSMEFLIIFIMYHTIENPDMRMIAQLNLAKEQADKANQAKSDFLSNMSHEIRTPLNAIVGFGQALSEEDLPPQAMSEVKDIMMASDNLLEIVNGILDISKIESGKLEIINKDYSFKKIFDEVVTLAKGRLGEKPLEFRVAYDESIPPVLFGDYSRIKEIMINLLTNAIKYTHEGYIELKVSSVIKDDICRIIISVEDSGIGIKQENINKLFTKFERLGVEEHATIEGTGLGLAITKKLLDLMNGQIVVQSVYGKGSRFTVAIDQKISVGHKLEDTASLDLTELETMDFSSKKVLVVDDNVINLKVAHRLLQEYKVQITEVQSGQAAIDLINAGNTYDLILMDDMMPKMSGVQTLQKLKTIPGFQMKVVALTANAITGMREKYLADGFDEYLAKPISKKELAKIIKKMLGN